MGVECNNNGYINTAQVCEHCEEDRKCHFDSPPILVTLLAYFSYVILVLVGYIREIMVKCGLDSHSTIEKNREGVVPLYQEFSGLYTRHIFRRVKDIFNRPISSAPGAEVYLEERESNDYGWTFTFTGNRKRCINMGSYNYLGFAEERGYGSREAERSLYQHGVSYCSPRRELGESKIHRELETRLSEFLGTDDAITFGMGFATNSMNIPALVGKGCLVLSDQLNHSSLVLGEKLSGATIKVFKHNDMEDLEKQLREAIVDGQRRSHKPWKKILVVVEGVYSMEGDILKLPDVIRIKNKYKAYLYVDEAHSIGAIGSRGRGVVDYWGCNPKDVDILMGTFTKSFNAAGGYIAGSRQLINHLRSMSHAHCYSVSMAPSVAKQIIGAIRIINGEVQSGDGDRRLRTLASNTRYFRRNLKKMGFTVYGDEESPVVPLLTFFPTTITCLIRALEEASILTVGVGFPAVSLVETRARFCLSAAHTKEMLDKVLQELGKAGSSIGIKHRHRPECSCPIWYGYPQEQPCKKQKNKPRSDYCKGA